jgi:alpha-D-ribose 1-methylphosphonate 5-triphosphate synthase subunit PhnG
MSIKPTVESLLLESDDEADLGDIDLSKITLEDILREEEMADETLTADSMSNSSSSLLKSNELLLDDEKLFSPANIIHSITSLPGMEVVPSTCKSLSGTDTTNDNLGEMTTTMASTHYSHRHNHYQQQQQQQQPWRSVLEIAEAREKQLLSCIGVELLSPLQVKRRLRAQERTRNLASKQKASNTPTSTSKERSKQNSDPDSSTSSVVKVKTTGVVEVEPMEIISRQLKKNMEFKENGPGSPTVVAIHSKFIAIGTSKGLVLIFDHFQNVSPFSHPIK